MSVTVTAPAKVNLTLEVLGRREDGYHEIQSVMQAVDLADTVVLTVTTEKAITLAIEGTADLVADERNTAVRAATAFLNHIGKADIGVHMALYKRIPMQAGMAGGSADAAAVLVGLNALFEAELSSETLCALGATVGADVPFCVLGGAALAGGIGTELLPVTPLKDGWLVAVKPSVNVSTAAAYQAIDGARGLDRPDHEGMCEAMASGDLARVGALLCNGFEQALALPPVTALLEKMHAFSPLGCRMTGSGSVVFALFDDKHAAQTCASALQTEYEQVYICRPVADGPVVMANE